MKALAAFVSGLVFGLGLIIAGMANPAKVLGFLDIAGLWDPSLIFVMAGGIGTATIAFAIARRRSKSILGEPMQIPSSRTIDARLVSGALLFGIGWGLAGVCPGPSFVLLGLGKTRVLVFIAAMLLGLAIANRIKRNSAA